MASPGDGLGTEEVRGQGGAIPGDLREDAARSGAVDVVGEGAADRDGFSKELGKVFFFFLMCASKCVCYVFGGEGE